MTGINHAMTGASIAVVIDKPLLALPLAFASHFILDSLPHFGEVFENRKCLSKTIWTIDLLSVGIFLLFLLLNQYWYLAIAAIVAMSPDFAWVYRFSISEKFGTKPPKPTNKFNKFHVSIQKYESRIGIFVELIYALVLIWFLANHL